MSMARLRSAIFSSFGAALHSIPKSVFSSRIPNAAANSNSRVLEACESEMGIRLGLLQQPVEKNYFNLEWMHEALDVVLYAHAAVEQKIPDLRAPMTGKDEKLVNEYLDDIVELLDVCNVLRESFADIERYQMLVQVALHSLDSKDSMNEKKLRRAKTVLHECMEAMKKKDEELDRQGQQKSKLETCSSILRRMGEKLTTPVSADSSKDFAAAIYGAKAITIFTCGVLASALLVKPRRPLPGLHLTNQPSWSSSMSRLQQKVKEEIDKRKAKGSIILLQEMDGVHSEVKLLCHILDKSLMDKSLSTYRVTMEDMGQSIERLQNFAQELKIGLLPLEHQISELYQILVSSRVNLLGALSHVKN